MKKDVSKVALKENFKKEKFEMKLEEAQHEEDKLEEKKKKSHRPSTAVSGSFQKVEFANREMR